jgi:pimeloyl-ACP methyl ester carboxylesterase
MLWLDEKMNRSRNPVNWEDFSHPSLKVETSPANKINSTLPAGLSMTMRGLPNSAESDEPVEPVTSEELLRRAKASFPIYAFGYNWLASNTDAANLLSERIKKVISENNVGPTSCSQVILVTHSMGGLVARACSLLPDMSKMILGIVHGVMPATGAAVAYRRCKVGMRDEDFVAGMVIGSDGKQVTAVFAQSPGALQLLPSEDYGNHWLEVCEPSGKPIATLPKNDPYEEIYLQRDKWWGLISEEWLRPGGGSPISWEAYAMNIKRARDFHRQISKKYHHNTFVFYGGGKEKGSFSAVRWNVSSKMTQGELHGAPPLADILKVNYKGIQTDGSNDIAAYGKDFSAKDAMEQHHARNGSQWDIRCAGHNSSGDGTVPAHSGRAPQKDGRKNVIKQFELSGVKHESAYKDHVVARQITYYAITKLAAMAELS